MNNDMIANHPHISEFIYFICTDRNNWMISNHPRLSANVNKSSEKPRLVSLRSVYSPIQLYIRRYTRTHVYIKTAMKACHTTFTNIFTYIYHQHTKRFVTTFIKNPHIYEYTIIWLLNSTKETGWGHTKELRSAPHEIFSSPLNMQHHTFLYYNVLKN